MTLTREADRMMKILDAIEGRCRDAARAGALRAEPQASQAKPLIAIAKEAGNDR